jgi:hypothetical protein
MTQSHDLVERLRKRAIIRRAIPRGEPDRISDLLEEAANKIVLLEEYIANSFRFRDIKVP